jgi:hypothetical protein
MVTEDRGMVLSIQYVWATGEPVLTVSVAVFALTYQTLSALAKAAIASSTVDSKG